MPITLEQSESLSEIGLEGTIDIASAGELKEQLLKALSPGQELRVSLQKAAALDVTAVQLLWAAERKAKGSGVGFSFTGQLPAEISAAMADAGLPLFAAIEEAHQA